MTEYTSAASNKKFNTFSLTDNFGNSYLFVRSGKGFFNIAKCEVLAKDRSIPKGYSGIIPDAVWFSDEEVADLLTESEERARRLESIESLLEEWIALRRSKSRRAKQPKQQLLHKREVAK